MFDIPSYYHEDIIKSYIRFIFPFNILMISRLSEEEIEHKRLSALAHPIASTSDAMIFKGSHIHKLVEELAIIAYCQGEVTFAGMKMKKSGEVEELESSEKK